MVGAMIRSDKRGGREREATSVWSGVENPRDFRMSPGIVIEYVKIYTAAIVTTLVRLSLVLHHSALSRMEALISLHNQAG